MQRHELTVETFLDHAAKWHPDVEVVTAGPHGSVRIGYAELRGRAGRLGAAFARMGVGRGGMIATLGWNTQGHVETWYATAGMGAVCHTLNPRLAPDQLVAMIAQSRPAVLLFGGGLADLAGRIAPDLPRIAMDEAAGSGWSGLDALIDAGTAPEPWGVAAEDDPAGLCFTSGTTGPPKGVLYTHRSNYLHTLRLLQADALALGADDRVMPLVPMFHANGWGLPFAAPAVGAGLVLPGRQLDGAGLARLIVDEGVTVAAGVPTVWLDLLDHVVSHRIAMPTLRRVYLGGAALPVEAQTRLEEGLGVSVHTSWGMTELSPLGTVAARGVAGTPPGSSGRTPIGLDLRLVDDAGASLVEQRAREGRLQAKGFGVVRRYWNAVDDAVDAEGWFDTGDLARIDADGGLTITGRVKDLIKSGGEWINPADIELIVGALPGVALVAVIGRPDERWGERPIVVLEPVDDDAPGDATVLAALEGRIARWWMPDAVIRIKRMPIAATGKIDKAALRRVHGVPTVAHGEVVRA